jgi:hypothetical protein
MKTVTLKVPHNKPLCVQATNETVYIPIEVWNMIEQLVSINASQQEVIARLSGNHGCGNLTLKVFNKK